MCTLKTHVCLYVFYTFRGERKKKLKHVYKYISNVYEGCVLTFTLHTLYIRCVYIYNIIYSVFVVIAGKALTYL